MKDIHPKYHGVILSICFLYLISNRSPHLLPSSVTAGPGTDHASSLITRDLSWQALETTATTRGGDT